MMEEENMQNVKTVIRSNSVVIINGVNEYVPAGLSKVVNSADIDVGEYGYGAILIKAGTEVGAGTIDVKYQIKGTDGNYYDHTSATQVTAAGTSLKTISNLDGQTGRIVVTIGGGSENDGFAAVYVEFIIKSR
jgi:hypothetical protein